MTGSRTWPQAGFGLNGFAAVAARVPTGAAESNDEVRRFDEVIFSGVPGWIAGLYLPMTCARNVPKVANLCAFTNRFESNDAAASHVRMPSKKGFISFLPTLSKG